jgi:hypothetical protein
MRRLLKAVCRTGAANDLLWLVGLMEEVEAVHRKP